MEIRLDDAFMILAHLFNTSFDVVYGTSCEYNQDTKTVYINHFESWIEQIMGAAREVMHHHQHEEGRGTHGEDMEFYKRCKLAMIKDPKLLWLQRSEPNEVEANAFCKVFADRLLKFAHDNKMLTTYKYRKLLAEAVDILALTTNDPTDFYTNAQNQKVLDKEKVVYRTLEAKYGNDITLLLTKKFASIA